MYSASTNFLVVWCSGIIVFFIYPCISATLSFRFLEIADQTSENFYQWFSIIMLQALSGMSFGLMIGSITDGMTAQSWA